jgi:hypothetical protein
MGEESGAVSYAVKPQRLTPSLPPIVMPEALGVAPPSLSSAPPFASPEPEAFTGDERKNSGDCVEAVWKRLFLGVACDPRCEACEASDCSCSSGPAGAGLFTV